MTEREWLDCTDADRMLDFVASDASERKLRLLMCAYFRRLWNSLPCDSAREAVESMERQADGLARADEDSRARGNAKMAAGKALYTDYPYLDLVWNLMRASRGPYKTRWRFGTTSGFPRHMIARSNPTWCAKFFATHAVVKTPGPRARKGCHRQKSGTAKRLGSRGILDSAASYSLELLPTPGPLDPRCYRTSPLPRKQGADNGASVNP